MEEQNKIERPPLTIREIVVDRAIGSFFGFYMIYLWLGMDDAKATLVTAFGIEFFAMTKAAVLLASMFCGVLGGYRLFKIIMKLKKTIKFIDVPDDTKS